MAIGITTAKLKDDAISGDKTLSSRKSYPAYPVPNNKKAYGKLYITNTITAENLEKARVAYRVSNLFIDKKFPMPDINNRGNENSLNAVQSGIWDKVKGYIQGSNINDTIVNNLRTKVVYWTSEVGLFSDIVKMLLNNANNINVFIDNTLSKHEWYLVNALVEFGVSIFVITDIHNYYTKIPDEFIELDIKEDTGISLNYKVAEQAIKEYKKTQDKNITTFRQIRNIFESPVEITNIYELGIDNVADSIESLSDLLMIQRAGYIIINDKFDSLTPDEMSIAYKNFSLSWGEIKEKILYIVSDILKSSTTSETGSIARAILQRFVSLEGILNESQLKNKLVVVLCNINKLLANKELTHIVFYGCPSLNDAIILDVLVSLRKYSILIIDTDKIDRISTTGMLKTERVKQIKTTFFKLIELKDSVSKQDVKINKHIGQVASTLAASVASSVDRTLFTGDTLGLYKAGQINKLKSIRLKTTFEEIMNWINEDAYLRPGFSCVNDLATLPVMFKIISGISEELKPSPWYNPANEYNTYISKLINSNTILFRSLERLEKTLTLTSFNNANQSMHINHCTDTADLFDKQLPFYHNQKIDKGRIKGCRNYAYDFLPIDKQDLILDSIETLINSNFVNYKSYGLSDEQYIDCVLQLLLTLHTDLLNMIHRSSYYGKVMRMVVFVGDTDNKVIKQSIQSMILLTFLSLIGFDILIFIPTGYNIIEPRLNEEFIYDKHIIGEPYLDSLNISRMAIDIVAKGMLAVGNSNNFNNNSNNNRQNKSKGLFSKLFGTK